MNITFKQIDKSHLKIIFSWLDAPHVQEFWDNSLKHRQDIQIFAEGRKVESPYFNGIFSYWLGCYNDNPYCLIMTSQIFEDDCSDLWRQNLSKDGECFSLDFCIGNINYFGKGLAAHTLEKFCLFFKNNIEPKVDSFFIDPDINNSRAMHVYQKAGFKLIGKFIMEKGEFAGQNTAFMVKNK